MRFIGYSFLWFFGFFYLLCLFGNPMLTLKWTAIILVPVVVVIIHGAVRAMPKSEGSEKTAFDDWRKIPPMPDVRIPGNGDAAVPQHRLNEEPRWKAEQRRARDWQLIDAAAGWKIVSPTSFNMPGTDQPIPRDMIS